MPFRVESRDRIVVVALNKSLKEIGERYIEIFSVPLENRDSKSSRKKCSLAVSEKRVRKVFNSGQGPVAVVSADL